MPAAAVVDLTVRRTECEKQLLTSADAGSADSASGYLTALNLSADEIKNLVDISAKSALCRQLESNNTQNLEKLIELLTKLASTGQCAALTVANLLSEMFDQLPLAQCQALFAIVEHRAPLWKSDQYFESCKNVLLRTCNDLLRRASKSLNTVFCGRIQLFLARLFPLDEKSALNLLGQFNSENITHYRAEPWETVKTEPIDDNNNTTATTCQHSIEESSEMQVDEQKPIQMLSPITEHPGTKSLVVDYELYSKFWSLQETFHNPNSLYTKEKWVAFQATANYITSIFRTYPLEDEAPHASSSGHKDDAMMVGDGDGSSSESVFFSKYLTNEKLLDLQLSDSTFRRCILLQFLITLQYLVTPAKLKSSQMSLTADQEKTVREMTEVCYHLLKNTPPRGEQFAASVEKLLTSEDAWSKWKNDGCPTFLKPSETLTVKRLRRRRPLGDELSASMFTGRPIRLGATELNRLFSTTSSNGSVVDNLPVCRAATAQPDLREFFTEAVTQLDGDSKVTEEAKLLRKSEWQWRALRLLTSSGPQFFTSGGDRPSVPQKKLAMAVPDFLDIQLRILAPILGIKLGAAKEAKDADSSLGGNSTLNTSTKTAKGGTPATTPAAAAGDQGLVTTEQMEQDGTLDEVPTNDATTEGAENKSGAAGAAASSTGPLVRDHLQSIALLVSAHWQALARNLAFADDEISFFETSDPDDKSKQAARMLTIWEERESLDGRHPVPLSQLETELRKVTGLESIADRLRQLPNVASPGPNARS